MADAMRGWEIQLLSETCGLVKQGTVRISTETHETLILGWEECVKGRDEKRTTALPLSRWRRESGLTESHGLKGVTFFRREGTWPSLFTERDEPPDEVQAVNLIPCHPDAE